MNLAELQTQINLLQQQVAALQQALEESRRENAVLRQKLDALARRFFGKKSEQLNAAQMELLLQGLVEEVVSEEKKEPPARPAPRPVSSSSQRLRTPDHLEVVRQVIEPELVRAQPDQWNKTGEEVSRASSSGRKPSGPNTCARVNGPCRR